MEENKVREATGATRERWVTAAEREYVENFIRMNASTEITPEELSEIGGQSKVLPMKCVWSIKEGDLYKCRAVVCGNYAHKDPSEEVYTAQAETASVMLGLKYAQVNGWETWKLDVEIGILQCAASRGVLGGSASSTSMGPMGIVKASEVMDVKEGRLRLARLSVRLGNRKRFALARFVHQGG